MDSIFQLYQQHPYTLTIATTWLFTNVITALVSSLPAPTKDSTPRYVYWFKVLNTIMGNIQRAKSTSIEGSPNWQDAVDKHIAANPPVPEPKP